MDRERIVPSCCDKSRNARVVRLGYDLEMLCIAGDERTEETPPKWLVTGKNSEGFTVIEQAFFCPFCGEKLPALRKKREQPPLVMRITDGGYYCDTCGERANPCECSPPEECWEEKKGDQSCGRKRKRSLEARGRVAAKALKPRTSVP
jgi:hypothetical protein